MPNYRLNALFFTLALAIISFGLQPGFASAPIFADRFEPGGQSPVGLATVDLRHHDGEVRLSSVSAIAAGLRGETT